MKTVIALTLFGVAVVFAQATLGVAAVNGTVRDQSGALVPAATVALTENAKGLVRKSETDRNGSFLFPAVIAGVYSLRVEKDGFNTEQIQALSIEVGQQATVAVSLNPGQVHTAITVRAPSTTQLSAESNTVGSLVDPNEVRELPLNGRNFLQLGLLAAGAVDITSASDLFTSNVGPPARTIVLPGTLPSSVVYSLNGMNITGSRDGELAVNPSVAAVDQFRVQENFLMPDQGVGPAVVNIVTKSGTNQFHGEVYEFLRNGRLDARSFFATSTEDLKRNQFGIRLGGPLRKDRIWFEAFYEGLRELTAFSTAGYSPTSEMFEGNFAVLGHTIYDPATYDSSSGTRQPFPGNIIPPSYINPIAKNLLNYYLPGSSLSSIPSNIRRNPRNTLDDDQGGLRADLAVNDQHHLFSQIFLQNSPSNRPELYPLSGLLYENGSGLAMLHDVWTFSPRAVNSLRIGFLGANAVGGNEAQDLGPILSAIGISNTFDQRGVTSINLQEYSSFGRSNGEVGNRDNRWQFGEEFTSARGKHTLAFGAEAHYRRGWHLNGNSTALGRLLFQPTFTAQLTRNSQGSLMPMPETGDSFADFLLGFPASGTVLGLPVVEYRSTQFLPFLQDSWKITSQLTLNYGVSWFLETPPDPQQWARNFVHGFDRGTGLLTYSALEQISSQPVAADLSNFAPRFGVAWQPGFLKATVIRAGFGTYYSQFPWVLAPYPLLGGSPIGPGISFTNPLLSPLPTYALGLNIFPPSPKGVLTETYAASLPPGTVVTALNENFRTAYVNQWNLSLQHSISGTDSIELNYVGSSGHRLANILDLSQCRPTADLFCSPANKPWPRYGLILYGDSSGNSSYEALLTKYEHRATYGLTVRFEYALAKTLADTWQSGLGIYNQVSQCRRCSKGPATFDVRHRAVGSLVWNLPLGRGKQLGGNLQPWANAAVGGWTVTAITTFATGQPVRLAAPNQTGSVLITPLPNRVCDGRSDRISSNIRNNGFLWFDVACFTVPQTGYFGNSGSTVLAGPGLNNWDIGFEKDFPLARDSNKLQFRAEMFNAWNHTQFAQPNGNAGAAANFGRISATRPPRLIQVALKLLW
jgi:hypothetical protein